MISVYPSASAEIPAKIFWGGGGGGSLGGGGGGGMRMISPEIWIN